MAETIPARTMDKSKDDGIFIRKVIVNYRKNGRHNLPWRKKATPYNVLVSEIMLQQTQVVRVLEKYNVWMKKYPSLRALKKATLKDVLHVWKGLGYQRRAKALYDIAQQITEVPTTFEKLVLLPSVGMYTATAVMAFAHNTFSYPMLETNIRTAIIDTYYSKKKKVSDETIREDVTRLEKNTLVKKIGARVWYSALMDYGAMLKEHNISHNTKSTSYVKQTSYKGSTRQLRAKVLFSFVEEKPLPKDKRVSSILTSLSKEGLIRKEGKGYVIA